MSTTHLNRYRHLMKYRLILMLVFQILALLGHSQKLKRVEVYAYERIIDTDSLATDTILTRIEHYDSIGFKYHTKSYMEGFMFQEEIWDGDSVRLVTVPGAGDNWRNIEYRYDKHGHDYAIIDGSDTSVYKNEYNDTLITRSVCMSGCDYIDHFYYNDKKQLVSFLRESPTGHSYSWEVERDELGRIVRGIMMGTITVHEYRDNPKVDIRTDYLGDDQEEMEKTITYYDELGRISRVHHYLQGRLLSKIFYQYFYYD